MNGDAPEVASSRVKYWEDKSDSEKIEFLAQLVVRLNQELGEMRDQLYKIHSMKIVDGQPVVPLHMGNMTVPRSNPDWMLNRRPQ